MILSLQRSPIQGGSMHELLSKLTEIDSRRLPGYKKPNGTVADPVEQKRYEDLSRVIADIEKLAQLAETTGRDAKLAAHSLHGLDDVLALVEGLRGPLTLSPDRSKLVTQTGAEIDIGKDTTWLLRLRTALAKQESASKAMRDALLLDFDAIPKLLLDTKIDLLQISEQTRKAQDYVSPQETLKMSLLTSIARFSEKGFATVEAVEKLNVRRKIDVTASPQQIQQHQIMEKMDRTIMRLRAAMQSQFSVPSMSGIIFPESKTENIERAWRSGILTEQEVVEINKRIGTMLFEIFVDIAELIEVTAPGVTGAASQPSNVTGLQASTVNAGFETQMTLVRRAALALYKRLATQLVPLEEHIETLVRENLRSIEKIENETGTILNTTPPDFSAGINQVWQRRNP